MSSIHKYNLSSLNLDGYGGEGYGSFNVSKEISRTDSRTEYGYEFVSYFIPLTGTWHDSGLNLLGVIATTCTGGCGYWDVTYYFKEDAYTLLNSLKKMNIKNINSLRVNQELDIGANDYEEGIFFLEVSEMSKYAEYPLYSGTEFGRILSKSSRSMMSCTVMP
jgi:hypothetical protein